MKTRARILMAFVALLWGTTFVLIKDALSFSTPLTFNLMRMVLAAMVLALIYRNHLRGLSRAAVGWGAVTGLCLAAGYQLQTAGLVYTTPARSALLTGMVVIFVPLFMLFPGLRPPDARRPGWNTWLGALLAFGGVAMLTRNGVAASPAILANIHKGDLLSLACAAAFALHCISLAHASPRISFPQLTTLQVAFCAFSIGLTLPLLEHPHVRFSPTLVLALAIAAPLATAAAFAIQSWAQAILPASQIAVLLTLEPVFAWITSWAAGYEPITPSSIMGSLLILSGIALTELV